MSETILLSQRRFDWLVIAFFIINLGFGPFYAIGLYAYIRTKEWIRLPSIIYSSVLQSCSRSSPSFSPKKPSGPRKLPTSGSSTPTTPPGF